MSQIADDKIQWAVDSLTRKFVDMEENPFAFEFMANMVTQEVVDASNEAVQLAANEVRARKGENR